MKTNLPILLLACLCGCETTPQPPLAVEPPRVVPITVLPSFEKKLELDRLQYYFMELKFAIARVLTEKLKTNQVVVSSRPSLMNDFEIGIEPIFRDAGTYSPDPNDLHIITGYRISIIKDKFKPYHDK